MYNGREHDHVDKLQQVVRGAWAGVGGRGQGREPPQGSQEPCKNGVVSVLGRVTFQQKRKRLAARYVVSCKLVFSPPPCFQD